MYPREKVDPQASPIHPNYDVAPNLLHLFFATNAIENSTIELRDC